MPNAQCPKITLEGSSFPWALSIEHWALIQSVQKKRRPTEPAPSKLSTSSLLCPGWRGFATLRTHGSREASRRISGGGLFGSRGVFFGDARFAHPAAGRDGL